jgi:hypothetical protein
MFAWIVIVAPWEQAIRVRLGRRVQLLAAGTYLRIPFIDRVYRQSIRRRLMVVYPQTLTTRDRRAITVGAAFGYSVADLMLLYNTLHDAQDTVRTTVAARISEYVAGNDFADCTPAKLEGHVRGNIDFSVFGLANPEFYITNFAAVKTYRFITGEVPSWSLGDSLSTTNHDGGQPK